MPTMSYLTCKIYRSYSCISEHHHQQQHSIISLWCVIQVFYLTVITC